MAEVTTDATTQNSAETTETSLLNTETKAAETKAEETTQTKTDAETKAAEGEQKTKTEESKPAGAPEKYEFKIPEGMTIDAKAVDAFSPVARELNLTNEQAQKVVDLYAAQVKAQVQAQVDTWTNTRKEWVNTVKADKEIGGQNLETNLTNAKKVIETYGTPELKKAFDDYGMGDHPEIVRLLSRIGKAMAEDKFHAGTTHASQPPEVVFFPTMQKK